LDLRRTANLAAYAFAAYRNPIGIVPGEYIRHESDSDWTIIVHPETTELSEGDVQAQSALAPTSGAQSQDAQRERTKAFHKATDGVLKNMKYDPICNLNDVTFIEQPGFNTQVWIWSGIDSATQTGHVSTPAQLNALLANKLYLSSRTAVARTCGRAQKQAPVVTCFRAPGFCSAGCIRAGA
jgi:hypothetical protein